MEPQEIRSEIGKDGISRGHIEELCILITFIFAVKYCLYAEVSKAETWFGREVVTSKMNIRDSVMLLYC